MTVPQQRKPRQIFIAVSASLIVVALTVVLLEGVARIFWKVAYQLPFSQADKILYALYPELTELEWRYPELAGRKDTVDILFLGGSALNPAWGNIEQDLREQVTAALKRPVRIYNMAVPGHTSRDSYFKYKHLADYEFDLVIFYHGINEARANNAPPELYKADYTHYAWYELIQTLEPYHGHSTFALPYTFKFTVIQLKDRLGLAQYVNIDTPKQDWLIYGSDIKSAAAFESNLKAIIALAQARQEPLLMMTFATYVPENYSDQAFQAQTLDYSLHLSPLTLWGQPDQVLAAVAQHNQVMKTMQQDDDRLFFVDQAAQMPTGARYFNDVCHFTSIGSTQFVDNMLDTVLSAVTPQ